MDAVVEALTKVSSRPSTPPAIPVILAILLVPAFNLTRLVLATLMSLTWAVVEAKSVPNILAVDPLILSANAVVDDNEVSRYIRLPFCKTLAESDNSPVVEAVVVALFQFQAMVLVALSILEDIVAAAKDDSVVDPVFKNDPFQ